MSVTAPSPATRKRKGSVITDPVGLGPEEASGAGSTPLLDLAGFNGSLGTLLMLAQSKRIDLAAMSMADMLDQLAGALRESAELTAKAGWLVIAATLLVLRSRLLLPADEPAALAAEAEAERLRDRLLRLEKARAETKMVADWLERRLQLGRDIFARGAPELFLPRRAGQAELDMTEVLWAAMALFEDPASDEPDHADIYRPPWLDVHSIQDARARIARRLAEGDEEGALLGALLPPSEPDNPARGAARTLTRRKSAWSSAFAACLELAKQGAAALDQEEPFGAMHVQRAAEEEVGRPCRRFERCGVKAERKQRGGALT